MRKTERRDGGNPHLADVTYCTIIRVRGVNNNRGIEKESRQVAVNTGCIKDEAEKDAGGGRKDRWGRRSFGAPYFFA